MLIYEWFYVCGDGGRRDDRFDTAIRFVCCVLLFVSLHVDGGTSALHGALFSVEEAQRARGRYGASASPSSDTSLGGLSLLKRRRRGHRRRDKRKRRGVREEIFPGVFGQLVRERRFQPKTTNQPATGEGDGRNDAVRLHDARRAS